MGGGPNPRRGVQIRGGSKSAVTLEGVSLLVELEDRSALALLKDGSFVRTICAIRSIS